MTLLAPLGLENVEVECFGDNIWWQWNAESPRVGYQHIRLERLDKNYPKIVVQRLESDSLEVRLKMPNGEPLPVGIQVAVNYPRLGGADGGRMPEAVSPGVFRLDESLLPEREISLWVTARGCKQLFTESFHFTEEGQKGVVELTLQLGKGDVQDVPVALKTLDGEPIGALPANGPDTTFSWIAVDPLADAAVTDAEATIEVEQWSGEADQTMMKTVDSKKVKTDQNGRFTVVVPAKYLAKTLPKTDYLLRVTVAHPRYVTFFDTVFCSELAEKGVKSLYPAFRYIKMLKARELSARVVDAEGRPMSNVDVYKLYYEVPDKDNPVKVKDGLFRTKVPVGVPLTLEFRALNVARNYVRVAADRTDLGEIRLVPGARITGRVLDGEGRPVRGISVTTRAFPYKNTQPNFNYPTDKDGRFRSDELAAGKYRLDVGSIHEDDDGKPASGAVKDAPGVYLPRLVDIVSGQPDSDFTLKPVESVLCLATLETHRPKPTERVKEGMEPSEAASIAREWSYRLPSFTVTGRIGPDNLVWFNTYLLNGPQSDDRFAVRAPKGLTDVTFDFGTLVQRFQLDPKSPILFGTGIHLAKLDRDLKEIKVFRYRETSLKIVVDQTDLKPKDMAKEMRMQLRYVREFKMRRRRGVRPFAVVPETRP